MNNINLIKRLKSKVIYSISYSSSAKKKIKKFPETINDIGDLDKLKKYFPRQFRENRYFQESFNGDIKFININKKEQRYFNNL